MTQPAYGEKIEIRLSGKEFDKLMEWTRPEFRFCGAELEDKGIQNLRIGMFFPLGNITWIRE